MCPVQLPLYMRRNWQSVKIGQQADSIVDR